MCMRVCVDVVWNGIYVSIVYLFLYVQVLLRLLCTFAWSSCTTSGVGGFSTLCDCATL